MMRPAADFDTPNNGASCRVRLVLQFAATSNTRSPAAASTDVGLLR